MKRSRGQVGAIEIARRHARAADEHFARLAPGDAAEQFIDQVNCRSGIGTPMLLPESAVDILARDRRGR